MRKASPEKQVFMCTNSEKISVSITKVHSERKKPINQWQKLPQFGTQFVEHRQPFRQNKNQTKTKIYQETTSPQKSTALFLFYLETFALCKVIMGNFTLRAES